MRKLSKHRTKTFALCVIAVAVAITMAMPQQASAANDVKKPKATNVQYITKEGKRTGIKSFTISPYSYYNISQDQKINADGDRTLKLDDAKLLQIAKSQIFPKWGIIAEGIFRDQANQLVTIEGSGMMSSDYSAKNSFDRHFSTGTVTNGYDYDWSVSDLAQLFAQEKSSQKGKTCWDETRVTGITQINSLDGARTLMGQELRNCSDDNDVSKDDFLGNGYQKNEDKRRLPDLEDSKSGDGFANIVTCVNRAGASGDYDYVTFGLAVYDFDITPVAAENLKYVEEADNDYTDGEGETVTGQNILLGNAGNINKVGISYQKDRTNGTTSYLRNNTTQEVTQSSGLENSVSEESTIGTDDTFEWGMEQEIGLELNMGGFGPGIQTAADPAPCMFPRATLNISNSWHELWSTTKSKSETQSSTKTKTTNTEVTLPGHTIATVEQSLENTKTTENYQQPVILSYKVAVFAMSGDYFNGASGGIENSRYDKQWMSVIFDGSDDPGTSGCYALGSLYNRAVTNQDTQGYDGAKGKYRSWCDKSAWNSSSKINWSDISNTLTRDTRSSHRIELGTGKKATTIKELAAELPLIEKAQMLTSKRESITSNVEQIIPLYSLGSVTMKSGSKEYEMKPEDTLYLDSIDLEGYDTEGAEFYEFDKAWGEWVLLDKDDKIIEDGTDQDELKDEEGKVKAGPVILENEDDTQKVTISSDGEGFQGKQKLKWRLIPNKVVDGKEVADKDTAIVSNVELTRAADSDEYAFMTNGEKENVNSPTITLNVRDTANDIVNFETEGAYKGPMNEKVNLSHVFTANAVDKTGKIRNVPVFWESKGTEGITVDISGEATFSKKGVYKVRPYSYNMNREKVVQLDESEKPVWLEITAQDKAALTSIVMNKPELDEDDTTLSEGTTALGFDLGSYTHFFDQYGDKWTGTEANPLPEVRYGVSPRDGAYIDGENILTVTEPGTYTVSAKAYDESGSDTGIAIKPIRITVTEQDRLASITMDEPALSRSQRTLQDQDDCITVENLKGLLTYYDQRDDEWTGKKPNVTFSIVGEPEDAEIKGGNFYAYAPGTYTIQPSATGYTINSIKIVILEDQHLVLKTEDPGRQYLYADGDTVELELERYINATTGYGGKWKGQVPELKFTLDSATATNAAKIETKTVYDSDDDYVGSDRHYFSTSLPGEYTVHVQPVKASEYSDALDDMLIRVVKGKKVAKIEFRNINEEADPEALTINAEASTYPSIDLSQYLNYYDGYGEQIDPARDHVKIPDCEYTVLSPAVSEDSDPSYELNREVLTAYEPEFFFVKAEMNVTNNDPSGEGEDTILEANTGFMVSDINWLHDFSGEWEITRQPTCTEDGIRVKRCTAGENCINHDKEACSEVITDSIPATGHEWSKYYRFDESDHSLYTVCEVCGEVNEESRTLCHGTLAGGVDSKGRPVPYGDYATCTKTAKYMVSTQNGQEPIEVPALGHHWGSEFEVTKPASCTETGEESIKYVCTRCGEEGETEFYRTIPKVQHEAEPDAWDYYTDDSGHVYKETCEDYGLKIATCKFEGCDEQLYNLISPTGHEWDEGKVVTEATSTKTGLRQYTCTHGCGATKTEVIPATGGQEAVDAAATASTAIAKAGKVNAKAYSAASYKAVKDAASALEKVLANPNATAAQIKAATQKLQKAISALKMNQKLSVKKKTIKVKVKNLKKKARTVKPLTVKGAKTKVTYKGVGVGKKSKKALKINKKTGKIKVKKKTKKGTYKMKVTITAAGSAKYAAAKKTVTVVIKVK